MLHPHSRSHSPRASACSISSYSSLPVVISRVVAFRRRYFWKLLRTFHSLVAESLPSLCKMWSVTRQRAEVGLVLLWTRVCFMFAQVLLQPFTLCWSKQLYYRLSDHSALEKQIQEYVAPQLSFPKFSGWITCSVGEMPAGVSFVLRIICILDHFD